MFAGAPRGHDPAHGLLVLIGPTMPGGASCVCVRLEDGRAGSSQSQMGSFCVECFVCFGFFSGPEQQWVTVRVKVLAPPASSEFSIRRQK